jgi:hypothetical protein
MISFRNLFAPKRQEQGVLPEASVPPTEIVLEGVPPFPLEIKRNEGFALLEWGSVNQWVARIERPALQGAAWTAAEHAWLLHMRQALGNSFELLESDNAMLLSSLEPNVAVATLDYMERTLRRVVKVLDGIAVLPAMGKDLLIVFDDDESYYRYVSYYYPDAGEFAFSSGMYVNAGCGHYVTVKNDLRVIEPVVAHEMTHGCLGHLPLPTWLNEGLAVNVEQRLAPTPSAHTPRELRDKHLSFWGVKEIQEFWSGASFLRTDDGNLLSYALARLIVEQVSTDWQAFKQFVLAANMTDAGAAAAKQYLNIDLGELVCALLEKSPSSAWSPVPKQSWDELSDSSSS